MMPRFCPRMFLKTNVSCWIERVDQRPSKLRVAGSSPAAPTMFRLGVCRNERFSPILTARYWGCLMGRSQYTVVEILSPTDS